MERNFPCPSLSILAQISNWQYNISLEYILKIVFSNTKLDFVEMRGKNLAQASQRIRNFSIIAHIDHGKSTLADRLIEYTGALSKREMEAQVLDNMDLERERGITIKLQTVRLQYPAKDGETYELNLIDTPGHVDFTYEVSRSLAACEGALLIVDAAQGIEAQTLANVYLALENNLEIIPVINKIDLPSAEPERVKQEIEDVIGLDAGEAILASAKAGIGIEDILEAVVAKVPPPQGDDNAPLKALIFDSYFDAYKGAISYVRVMEGRVAKGTQIKMMSSGKVFDVTEVGMFTPALRIVNEIKAGQVGYIAASIKNVRDTQVGDTITDAENPALYPLPGYRKATPMVFCGLYPVDSSDYGRLKDALEKLHLNDSSLVFEPETSSALGFGYRCGFLGLLHMDVIQERLEREYDLNLITTAPSVVYKVYKTDGEVLNIDNPSNLPKVDEIETIEEPIVKANIMVPSDFVGAIMELNQEKRGNFLNMDYLSANRVSLIYELPLSEIVYDYFDQLKSRTKGYASLDYELAGYKAASLVKLDVLLNGELVDALSFIVHKEKSYARGRRLVEKLREIIPRQMFEVPIQAVIGQKVVARETVKAMRKDVLAKCYGGDISRKRKLLEKQKEGKKRMKQVGSVEIPQDAFMAVLKIDD
ncbi:GTP-binding protein LepA [Desulfitobacterium dehalogenans ATCC 51507]|uniref:Elongation factor 4 n=1 Tax=Desulfitobacterium dehalogenans (strain ATCC 51507 / DSM 9161 / JW/IU-DC1) TaxID=756499 RepID=I4ADB0_DESDJ|nr:GTP-binding protein LepA [Desulfitobacterium dehalogenans ATCC 51507]